MGRPGLPNESPKMLKTKGWTRGRSLLRGFSWRILLLAVMVGIFLPWPLAAEVQPEVTEPKILSVFPAGGMPGKTVEAEIRGNLLEGATSVWLEVGGLTGRVQNVAELKEEAPPPAPSDPKLKAKPLPVFAVAISVEIPATARPGTCTLRLVTPRGISSGIPFQILDESVVAESTSVHSTAKQAQQIGPPSVIFAKIAKPGEVDFYQISAKRGQVLTFEVSGAQNFDPRLALYRRGGSWFDADRPTRVLLEEERTSDLMFAVPRATYRAPEDGEYFLEVSSLFGKGSADSTYQLRIASGAPFTPPQPMPELAGSDWTERSFSRGFAANWIEGLAARGVIGGDAVPVAKPTTGAQATGTAAATPSQSKEAAPLSTRPELVREQEPNDLAAQAVSVALPAILEGAIDRSGDMDSFRFKVEPGQKIAFEIETPGIPPPQFNPRIGVVDSADHEFFSNVDRRLSMFNNNADPHVFLKAISSKSTYSFERGGEYILQIRDITARYGNPDFRYRILIRQQVPHIGETAVADAEQINLRRGEPRRLAVTAHFEEGFTGDVSFSVEGLPPGVEAHPALQYDDGRAPLEVPQNPEVVMPKEQKAAIVLVAAPDAPLTPQPVVASLRCRPIAKGRLGPSLLVRSLPIMVVASQPEVKAEAGK